MENQTPRTHPTFWRSPAGVTVAIVGGVAAVAGVIALFERKAAATTTTTTTTVIPPVPVASSAMVPGHWYIFSVTAASDPTIPLQQAGFATVQAEIDPLTVGGFVVSAQWIGGSAGTATTVVAPAGLTIGGLADNGVVQPPVPESYLADTAQGTGATVPLSPNGPWYAFSVRTSFLSTVSAGAAAVAAALVNSGWKAGAMVTAAADMSSTPDTWNVFAQWDQGSSEATDGPPLWILIPQRYTPTGAAAPVTAVGPLLMQGTPTAPPGNAMP